MVKIKASLLIIAIGFAIMPSVNAQKVDAFVQVRLSKRTVYAQEPIRATVTVYTATWFTQPLDFNNLQIPNAFIIPFSRTVPGVYHISGKQYAGLEFYYILYPYKPGTYEVPAIRVVAETPSEGGFKGTRVTLTTQPVKYTVREMPKSYTAESWFVARNVTISEQWSKPLRSLKVGDLVERTVRIQAQGTLPNFIPESKSETPKDVSVYPEDPQLIDQRNDYEANGTRIERTTYLFEKAGELIIPGEAISWWDPVRQRMQTRRTKDLKINVLPNQNPGMLASVRDSLDSKKTTTATVKKSSPLLIFGMPWKQFAVWGLVGIAVCFVAIKLGVKGFRKARARRMAYKETERYKYRKFIHSADEVPAIVNSFYDWWMRLPQHFTSVQDSPLDKDTVNQWISISEASSPARQNAAAQNFKKTMSKLRKTFRHKPTQTTVDDHQRPWD